MFNDEFSIMQSTLTGKEYRPSNKAFPKALLMNQNTGKISDINGIISELVSTMKK